jgi:cysteine synthase A
VPRARTAAAKLAEIAFFGGRCVEVEPGEVYAEAERIARECTGHYMDQFTYAERATDWRGNNNIAESIFSQLRHEPHPLPRWIVVGAGTGGTSATIGRYIRYRRDALATTQLAVVDPEHSAFFDAYAEGRSDLRSNQRGCIEGIGRPRVEPSFVPTVIDRMLRVPDARSFAAALALSARLGRRVGPSSGTNLAGVLQLAREMAEGGERGSIVSLICDAGERYADTLFDPAWQLAQGLTPGRSTTWRRHPIGRRGPPARPGWDNPACDVCPVSMTPGSSSPAA